jgi:hypothetical protein
MQIAATGSSTTKKNEGSAPFADTSFNLLHFDLGYNLFLDWDGNWRISGRIFDGRNNCCLNCRFFHSFMGWCGCFGRPRFNLNFERSDCDKCLQHELRIVTKLHTPANFPDLHKEITLFDDAIWIISARPIVPHGKWSCFNIFDSQHGNIGSWH